MGTLRETVGTTPPFAWGEWEEQIRNPGKGSRRPRLGPATVQHAIPVA
jgi:hypothetical protein